MKASWKNWTDPTPIKIKKIGDMCVYTLPMWQGLIMTSPFGDKTKLWLNFIIGGLLIIAKVITKMFSVYDGHEGDGSTGK